MTVHKGIKASIHEKNDVVDLYIDAAEADQFFYWIASSEKSALKLKKHFSKLGKSKHRR